MGLLLFCISACNAPATEAPAAADSLTYSVHYDVRPDPARGIVAVEMRVDQDRRLLRELRFRLDERISIVEASGNFDVANGELRWLPGDSGGTLRWTANVIHQRNSAGHDAWLGDAWGLFRAEDIIPRATTRTLKGALSETRMAFSLPARWSVVTPYYGAANTFQIDKKHRRFDQPDGWIVMGQLGVRRETIANIRVAVAAPVEHSVRRMDMLALLNWTLPELERLLPDLPQRLTIVSAGDPMWRGGLSAPGSLYIHAERPNISENATSTLLHEVMHAVVRIRAESGHDWIVEGLAEYYSLELLRRSGTISDSRYEAALEDLQQWGKSAERLCQKSSRGAGTALAVSIMAALDREIRQASEGVASLDDVLRELHMADDAASLSDLRRIVSDVSGKQAATLRRSKLPGCSSREYAG